MAVAHEELSQFKVYLRQYFFESTFKLAGFFFFAVWFFPFFFHLHGIVHAWSIDKYTQKKRKKTSKEGTCKCCDFSGNQFKTVYKLLSGISVTKHTSKGCQKAYRQLHGQVEGTALSIHRPLICNVFIGVISLERIKSYNKIEHWCAEGPPLRHFHWAEVLMGFRISAKHFLQLHNVPAFTKRNRWSTIPSMDYSICSSRTCLRNIDFNECNDCKLHQPEAT